MELDQDMLARIFAGRENRFRLLDAGVAAAGWQRGEILLETGCSTGDAAAHLARRGFTVTAVDLEADRIAAAAAVYGDKSGCVFLRADACALPFESESFDGVYSEAAFSVIADKSAAIGEYRRCLKVGGRVLINDFATKNAVADGERGSVRAVPCFAGAHTMSEYEEIFSHGGFTMMSRREELFEFASILTRLSREIGVNIHELGGHLTERFGGGRMEGERFFEKAKLTFCQMIFQKMV